MKTIKEYLNENFFKNLGIDKKAQIEDWLKKYCIYNYTINSDLTIDVNGYVVLDEYPDEELPEYIKYNYVKKFKIINSNITSLRGVPKKCEGFSCINCNNLTSLKDAPKECKYFNCSGCNSLTSLKGAPKKCEEFSCNYCGTLTSLKGAPKKCKIFSCFWCHNLISLEGAPEKCEEFNCHRCKGEFTEEDVKKVCSVKIISCD